MKRILRWMGSLDQRQSRGDLWVIFILLTGVSCLFEFSPCQDNSSLLMTIIVGMFSDLVGSSYTEVLKAKSNANTKQSSPQYP